MFLLRGTGEVASHRFELAESKRDAQMERRSETGPPVFRGSSVGENGRFFVLTTKSNFKKGLTGDGMMSVSPTPTLSERFLMYFSCGDILL